jgi:hypothetical protein
MSDTTSRSELGNPLDCGVRCLLERGFGRDFSHVRIHTDPGAAQATRSFNARALTIGSDIFFDRGEYAPDTASGRHLLAHELAHTAQQSHVSEFRERSVTDRVPMPRIQKAPLGLARQPRTPVDPEIANLPAVNYVDNFREAYYELGYRAEGGNLSTWLTLEYADGTLIDVNMYEFVEVSLPVSEVSEAMRRGYVGIGDRIFPRLLTPQTAPRTWAARQAAIDVMEESNYQFMLTALGPVMFILSMTGGVGVVPRATPRAVPVRPRIRARAGAGQSTTPGGTGTQAAARAGAVSTGVRQAVGYTRSARNAPELGGFRAGISPEEIAAINRQFGGSTLITGHPSSALAAASRQQGFWSKAAAIVREIAGRHMFNDANKRTASAVVNELRRRNQVVTGVEGAELRRVINQVATGELRTIEEIARALRGF